MIHSDSSLCQIEPHITSDTSEFFQFSTWLAELCDFYQFLLTNWGVPFWDLARASAHAVVEWIEKGWVLSVGGVWRPRPYAIAIAMESFRRSNFTLKKVEIIIIQNPRWFHTFCLIFTPGEMIQFDYILFFKWVLQPLEPPPSSNPLCPGLPWIHRTRLCRGIHPTVWHRRPAAPYGHHHPRNRQWSQHRGPSILSYCDTWPFEKSDFQFWIPRLDTSISFLLKTKLSPWKNRTRDVFVKNLEFPEVQCWCVWPWAQRWPIWHFEIGQSLLWNLCCHQWLIGCSFMLDSEWWFTNHSGERSTLGESISPGDLFGFDDWSFSHRSYAEETLVTEGKSFGG